MTLKNIVWAATAAIVMAGCQGNKSASTETDNFTLQGKFENAPAGPVYLYELTDQQFVPRDTAQVAADGTFAFEGKVKEPTFYRISLNQQTGIMLVLDSGKIKVDANVQDLQGSLKIEGSPESALFQQLNKLINESRMQQMALEQRFNEAMQQGNEAEAEQIRQEYLVLQKGVKNFIATHPGSVVSAFGTISLIDPVNDFAFADSMATLFTQNLPNSKYTAMLNERLKSFRSTAIGQAAPEITLATPAGTQKSLSSLRGKYVLIDFWASWCGPCRKENPNVVKMYNKYKNKGEGFEIFGVSLDQSKEKWLAAIEKDQLSWPHVSDLKGWESSAAQLYNVTAIPQTVLIDPEGKIIAKGLRGEDLEEKLASLLQ